MSKELKRYFTFSVALNLLFAGFFLGSMSHKMVAPPPPPPTHAIGRLLQTLPESQRAQFETAMEPFWKEMDTLHAHLDAQKEKASALLKAEPFNETAYLAQARHAIGMHEQGKLHLVQGLADLAKTLTPEERTVLAEIVLHPPAAYCQETEKPAP